jgi:2-C-methyl-D-erythritol 2,4-cyclodiphosphate synthase
MSEEKNSSSNELRSPAGGQVAGIRIGQGVDFHQLAEGRELWVGGIKIEHSKGAVGHSDADVLLHAICDAILGAACLGDIGTHFPDTDQQYKNIDSKILLQQTIGLMKNVGYTLVNIDRTLCLEKPKIKPYVPQMQAAIAAICGLSTSDVSIKATTTERMGFVGREEGLVAYATVLLQRL